VLKAYPTIYPINSISTNGSPPIKSRIIPIVLEEFI
jgi:hypothetical protein